LNTPVVSNYEPLWFYFFSPNYKSFYNKNKILMYLFRLYPLKYFNELSNIYLVKLELLKDFEKFVKIKRQWEICVSKWLLN